MLGFRKYKALVSLCSQIRGLEIRIGSLLAQIKMLQLQQFEFESGVEEENLLLAPS